VVLVVVRHAKAEEKSEFFGQDRLRPLTEEGRQRMRKNAARLRQLISELDCLVASPLVRAQQTAEIIKEEFGLDKIETTELLSPGLNPAELAKYLNKLECGTVAVVGHEPDLGELCSWLLSGQASSFIPFRKGGVCVLEFQGSVGPQKGELILKLDPRHLLTISGTAD